MRYRRRAERRTEREVWFADLDGGLSEIHGSLLSPDAHALDKRLNALAGSVCEHDPRTRVQRRADALGALAAGADRLRCRCGRDHCAAGKRPAATPVVIHVIVEQATSDSRSGATASEVCADGLISPELIAELADQAKLVPLVRPIDAAPEPGYVPSKKLADFVRCRDLTCRWPGCDRPAFDCDIDHTVPHADGGPTHASNLKCYCRTHRVMNPSQSPAFTKDPVVALRRMARSFSYRIEQPSTATPIAVYETLVDVERWPDWVPSLIAASWERRGAPDTGEGGIRRTRSHMLGTLREEILPGTRPHRHSYRLLGHALGINSYRALVQIDERPNGCLITWTGTLSSLIPGLGRPLQIFARSHIKRLAAALAREAQRLGR